MEPMAKIVKGYAPAMPSFKDQIGDDQMDAIIAFMKSLK
jgi:cytochrome c oxidase subunit 2